MGVAVCLLTYLGVALGGDSVDPKLENSILFLKWGRRFPCWNPRQTGEGGRYDSNCLEDLPGKSSCFTG